MHNQRPNLVLHLTLWLLPPTILIANGLLFWFGCSWNDGGRCDLTHITVLSDALQYTVFAVLIGLIITGLYVTALSTGLHTLFDLFWKISDARLRDTIILAGSVIVAFVIGLLQFVFVPQLIIAVGLVPISAVQITVFELGIVWSMGGLSLVILLTTISAFAIGTYLRRVQNWGKHHKRIAPAGLRVHVQME